MGRYSAAKDLDLHGKARWYVIASRTQAEIYTNGLDRKFHLIDRLSNPKGQFSENDLGSNKPGRSFSSAANGTFHHGLGRQNKRHEHAAKRFAREITRMLEHAYQERRFEGLVLAAEPHFLGLLRETISPSLQRVVQHEIHHRYVGSSHDEIRNQIFRAIEQQSYF